MIPLLVGIANDIGTSRSKLLYPAMACANIATQMTFMGQGASNMAWNDVMMKAGAPNPLHVWDLPWRAFQCWQQRFVHDLCRLQAHA